VLRAPGANVKKALTWSRSRQVKDRMVELIRAGGVNKAESGGHEG